MTPLEKPVLERRSFGTPLKRSVAGRVDMTARWPCSLLAVAIYQDGPSGDIVLFAAASRKAGVVHRCPGALVAEFKWGKGEKQVTVAIEPIRESVE
jgi:hypothetical protein